MADLQTSYVLEEIASRMKIKNGSFNVRFRGGFFQDLTYMLELKPEDFEKIQIDWPPTSTAPAPTEKGTSESGRS